MKKVLCVMSVVFIITLMGCTNKADLEDLKNQNAELAKNNETLLSKIEKISAENEDLFANNSALLIKIDELEKKLETLEEENSIRELRKDEVCYEHKQTLNFNISGYDTKIYKEPFSNDVIYIIQKGDTIEVLNILTYQSANKNYITVKTPIGEIGYIKIGGNPYADGKFSCIETIFVDGETVRILKMEDSFHVSDGVDIRTLPTVNSESIHVVTHKEGFDYYRSSAITEDYKWVKIKVNEYEGWVRSNTLSKDSGGPTIWTPKEHIEWVLIDANMF